MKRINSKIKTWWGISEIGFSMMAGIETMYFIYFLTDVALLPLGIVGAVTGIGGIGDAVAAVLAGIVLDKTSFKKGKYRPWLIYAPPLVMVFFIFMFSKIGGDVVAGVICGVGYVLSHFFWNIAWTANRNLMALLTDDQDERSYLSGRLAAGAGLGSVISSYGVPVISAALLGVVGGVGSYTLIAAIFSACFIMFYYIHYIITKGYDDAPIPSTGKAVTFADMGKAIAGNFNLIMVVLHHSITGLARMALMGGVAYYAKIVLGDPSLSKFLLMFFSLGAVFGPLFSASLAKKFGVKKTNIIGVVGFAVVWLIAFFMPANVPILCFFMFLGSFVFGFATGIQAQLYVMCGTYSYWKTGKDTRGIHMAFLSLSIKIGVALRSVLIAAVLAAIGYSATIDVSALDAATRASLGSGIRMLVFVIPIALMAISLIPFALFRLKDSDMNQYNKEISEREQTAREGKAAVAEEK